MKKCNHDLELVGIGSRGNCLECSRIRDRERYENNPGPKRKSSLLWQKNNPEKVNAKNRKYRLNNLFQVRQLEKNYRKRNPKRRLELRLLWTYSLSLISFESLKKSQKNRCAVCNKVFGKLVKNRPNVDHDHKCCRGARSCGRCVRGLLCLRCNYILSFYDNEKLNGQILKYLGKKC